MDIEKRLSEIETKIAHQDNIISDLSDEVYKQQKIINSLHTTCAFLIDRMRENADISPENKLDIEKPPHY